MNQIFVETKWWNVLNELKVIVQKETDHEGNTVNKEEAFEYYSELYFEYVSLSHVANDCYEALIHPQKREDIKNLLILILCRIIDLRHCLVHWNTGGTCQRSVNAENGNDNNNNPVPWEYLDMHQCLSKLKKRPLDIQVPIPAFLKDDECRRKQERDALVKGYMQLKHSLAFIPLEDKPLINKDSWGETNEVDVGPKADPIKVFDTSLQESNMRRKKSAILIQKYVRGYLVRLEMMRFNEKEHSFIGLIADDDEANSSNKKLRDKVKGLNQRRKESQEEVDDEYREVLVALDELVRRQEFFDMKQSLMKERVEWVTEQITQTNEIPGDLENFYKMKSAAASISDKDADVTKIGKSNDEKSKDVLLLMRPTKLLDHMSKNVAKYEEIWASDTKFESQSSFPSKYDEDVAKNIIVRDKVYNEARKHVDGLLLTNLQRLKAIQSSKGSSKKGADKKKKKGKSGKGKKSKGKGKALPGEKLPGLKSMDSAHMLSILIENKLVNNAERCHIDDMITSDIPEEHKKSQHPVPTIAQIRNMVVEYCVLPLGSQQIMDKIDDKQRMRSILLYGCEKSGKTTIAQAIANHTNALVINLSPSKIPQKYLTEKHGTTKLVHMAFTVAKDPKFAPVIIYLDECEIYFQSSKKKKKANAALKLQKDLLIYKNQALSKDDRVLVVGCSRSPGDGEMKTMKWKGASGKPEKQGFFEKCIHIPCPTSGDRMVLWKKFIKEKVKTLQQDKVKHLNFALLSQQSEGYTAGMIKTSVEQILTLENIKIRKDPFNETMFINELQKHHKKVTVDEENCHKFTESFYTSKKQDKAKKKSSKNK